MLCLVLSPVGVSQDFEALVISLLGCIQVNFISYNNNAVALDMSVN